MSTYTEVMDNSLPLCVTHEVRNRCLCLHVQQAARALARRFDEALKPVGLTHGQYSLLISLNRSPPTIGETAQLLAMDRTTLTANLKPLERRGLLTQLPDQADKRARRLHLTDAGRTLLNQAVPLWRTAHDEVDLKISGDMAALKDDLTALSLVDIDADIKG
ncbi:MAG: MarR family winged helix-turn-helix transcriptional regulator [bacterium]